MCNIDAAAECRASRHIIHNSIIGDRPSAGRSAIRAVKEQAASDICGVVGDQVVFDKQRAVAVDTAIPVGDADVIGNNPDRRAVR